MHRSEQTGLFVFLKIFQRHHFLTARMITRYRSEGTCSFVLLKLQKSHHLFAPSMLTLVLHGLDQLGGEQGGAVPQVDRAGRALGNAIQGLNPQSVSGNQAMVCCL